MKVNKIMKIYALWTAIVTLSLLVTPALVQIANPDREYKSINPENVVEFNTSEKEWQRTASNSVQFDTENKLETSDFGISMNLRYEVHSHHERIAVCTYKIYLNGKYVDEIEHSIDGFRNLSGRSTYDPVILPIELLANGDNLVEVEMTFASTTSIENQESSDTYIFNVQDMKVAEIPRDTDGDGINDAFDLLQGRDNTFISLVASLGALPLVSGLMIVKKE